MDSRWILGGSLALNAALIAILIFAKDGSDVSAVSREKTAATSPSDSRPPPAANTEELRSTLEQLRAKGIEPGLVKKFMVSLVQAEPAAPARAFWEPRFRQIATEEVARFEQQQRAEQTLTTLFGAEAQYDPAFAPVFLPLHKDFDFLSADKLRGLQALIAQANRTLASLPIEPGLSVKRSEVMAQLNAGVEQLLGADEFREYELRRSSIAQQLRELEFELDESEFRRMFAVYAEAQATRGESVVRITAHADDQTSSQVREILGEQRFRQYEMSQDPRYRVLSSLAASYRVPDANIVQAYALLRESDERAESLQRQGPVMALDARAKWAAAERTKNEQLRALLGEPAYAASAAVLATGVRSLAHASTVYPTNPARTAVPMGSKE
ncbi:hypothetical protein JM946_17650 [Steroidobacter sp. S1-65]|uniref:Uncharacterized protein n=1 Tax=Steroidobacter gossypii TaxID=2805490 RepID=A0ABS1X052_9GAMM|nr:hypothetical protein [Steroidobacter gossypii]MBM0106557.1 hypothetical protein [Steroidobacter gossypii]